MITIENTVIENREDLFVPKTKALLEFYNKQTGKNTKKFASREKGEEQVWNLIKDKVQEFKTTPENNRRTKFDLKPECASVKPPRSEKSLRGRILSKLLGGGATIEEIREIVMQFDRDRGKPHVNVIQRAYDATRLLNSFCGYGIKEDDNGVITAYKGK